MQRPPAAGEDLAVDLLGVLDDELVDTMDERVAEPLGHRLGAPGQPRAVVLRHALCVLRDLDEPFAGIVAAVQHDVLDALAQLRIEVVVDADHAGVDDAHVHPGLDRVVQEDRVDGFAHRVVAAEREADVADAAAHLRARQVGLDPARRLDEVDRVVVVLLDAGRDREDVRVEDDVLGREADLVDQDPVGAFADLRLALERVGLAFLVERHHDRGRAIAPDQPRMVAECVLALLQRDRVDDALALNAAQASFDHLPLRAVDHDRHARDLGLAGDQVQEANHRRLAVEHRLVHVDVDHLRAVLDLLAGNAERLLELAVQDQARERLRAGDIGALADVDEQRIGADQDRLEAGQLHRGDGNGIRGSHRSLGRRAAAPTAAQVMVG